MKIAQGAGPRFPKHRETPDASGGRRVVASAAMQKQGQPTTFLVEHYRPGISVANLKSFAARVRDAAAAMERDGKPVWYVRSTIVPRDESSLCVFEAASEELVREVYERAGVAFERISTAISVEG
jgi:uncharacterized protein DUF4242